MIQNRLKQYFSQPLVIILLFVLLFQLSSTAGIGVFLSAGAWVVLILFMHYVLPQISIPGQTLQIRETVKGYALMGAFFCLSLQYVSAALLSCLALSPYDNSVYGIFYNIVRVLPFLLAREMVRAYVIGSFWFNKRKILWVVLITLILFLNDLNIYKLLQPASDQAQFIYMAETVIPLLCQHILLTFLAYFGGFGAAVIFACLVEIPQFFIPILPNLPWIAKSAIGICFPLGLILLASEWDYRKKKNTLHQDNSSDVGFLASLFASVVFLWFCIGVFPVYPSVVLTGSMEPVIYPGDIVLIQKFTEEKEIRQLTSGDIITFRRENISITHRIIDVIEDEAGNLSFRTKGDNNKSPDEQLVLPNDIQGLVKNTVPKAGLPILVLKSSEEIPEGVVDDHVEWRF